MSSSPLFLNSDSDDVFKDYKIKRVPSEEERRDVVTCIHPEGDFSIHRKELSKAKLFRRIAESHCNWQIDVSCVPREVLECWRNFSYSTSYFDEPNSGFSSKRKAPTKAVSLTFHEIWECVKYAQQIKFPEFANEGLLVWGRKYFETGDVGIDDKEVEYVYALPHRNTAIQRDFLVNVYARHEKTGLFNYKFPNAFLSRVLNVLHTAHLSGERLGDVRTFLDKRNKEPFSNPLAGKRVVQIVEHPIVIE